MSKDNPVVEVAKEQRQKGEGGDDILTLSTGVRVRVVPVSPSLIADAQNRIPYPEPPMFYVEAKGRDEPNYNDPHYKRQLEAVDERRGMAALDAYCMFAIELVDGLPDDDAWIRRLKLLGHDFDETDDVTCEFYYKKYVAVTTSDFEEIQLRSVSPRRIAQQEASFRRDEG